METVEDQSTQNGVTEEYEDPGLPLTAGANDIPGEDDYDGGAGEESTTTIEDLAENGSDDGYEEKADRLPSIAGTGQLSLLAGGEEPDAASMKLRGGSIPVEGEFEKGDTVRLEIVARVAEVHFVDKIDNAGYVVTTERRHVAKIVNVRRTDED